MNTSKVFLKKPNDRLKKRIYKCNPSLVPTDLWKKPVLSLSCQDLFLHCKLSSGLILHRTSAKDEPGINAVGDVWSLCTSHNSCTSTAVDGYFQLKEDRQGSRETNS